jgi:hypothetical protein
MRGHDQTYRFGFASKLALPLFARELGLPLWILPFWLLANVHAWVANALAIPFRTPAAA